MPKTAKLDASSLLMSNRGLHQADDDDDKCLITDCVRSF